MPNVRLLVFTHHSVSARILLCHRFFWGEPWFFWFATQAIKTFQRCHVHTDDRTTTFSAKDVICAKYLPEHGCRFDPTTIFVPSVTMIFPWLYHVRLWLGLDSFDTTLIFCCSCNKSIAHDQCHRLSCTPEAGPHLFYSNIDTTIFESSCRISASCMAYGMAKPNVYETSSTPTRPPFVRLRANFHFIFAYVKLIL